MYFVALQHKKETIGVLTCSGGFCEIKVSDDTLTS